MKVISWGLDYDFEGVDESFQEVFIEIWEIV